MAGFSSFPMSTWLLDAGTPGEWIDEPYPTREHGRHHVIDCVAHYCNHERLQSTLDYRPPAEFEAIAA